jgi:SAM-dependent methyltransferase
MMGFYQDRVLPILIHSAMSRRDLADYRRRSIARAKGRVLEIGIGPGLNLPLYGPGASAVYGIDPSGKLLQWAARQRGEAHLVQGTAEAAPFESGTFDTVVTTWTLCSIPEVLSALREMRRLLRRDGRLLFVEHGLAPDRNVARWQNRLTPCWKCLGGGCHLNRKIDDLLAAAGFHIDKLDTGYVHGRNPFTFMYEGVAHSMN